MARIDGHFEANLEVKTRLFVCWLIGLWAVLLTCAAVSETFSGLSTTWGSHESSALPLHLQNGSLPPFEIPVFEHEFMLQHSGSMPLTRVLSKTRSSQLRLFGQNAGFSGHHFVQSCFK